MKTVDELQSRLGGFTGTEAYHRATISPMLCTDGVVAMAEAAKAYWLIDVAGSYQLHGFAIKHRFQLWRIETKDNKAVVTMREDSNRGPLITQEISYTDFPEGVFEWYVIFEPTAGQAIMLLKGEY